MYRPEIKLSDIKENNVTFRIEEKNKYANKMVRDYIGVKRYELDIWANTIPKNKLLKLKRITSKHGQILKVKIGSRYYII